VSLNVCACIDVLSCTNACMYACVCALNVCMYVYVCPPSTEELWIKINWNIRISDVIFWSHARRRTVIGTKTYRKSRQS